MVLLQINATYGLGSTGRIVKDIDEIARNSRMTSYVACSVGPTNKNIYHIGNLLDHKLHAFLCRLHGRQAYFSRIPTRKLITFIEKIQPDIVHLHNLHSNYINLKLLLNHLDRKKIPVVITMHDCWYYTGKCFHYTEVGCKKWKTDCSNCPKKKLDTPSWFSDYSAFTLQDRKQLFEKFNKLYVVGASNWIASEARQSLLKNAKISHCYNGVDTNVFTPTESILRNELGFKTSDFIILGMNNKWLLKQNEQYNGVIKTILDSGIRIVLIGNSNIIHDERIVIIPTVKSAEKMAEWYSMADVFVNLSLEDTLPFVNIESQACGTPVITHRTSGATETISDETGLLVEPGNPFLLFMAVQTIKMNGKNYYSEKCIERVRRLFNREHSYDEYFRIYEEIRSEKKSTGNCSY